MTLNKIIENKHKPIKSEEKIGFIVIENNITENKINNKYQYINWSLRSGFNFYSGIKFNF